MSRALFIQCFGTNKCSELRTAIKNKNKKPGHPCPWATECFWGLLPILVLWSWFKTWHLLTWCSWHYNFYNCKKKNPSSLVVSSDYRTVCLKYGAAWGWEMAWLLRACCSGREHEYASQQPTLATHCHLGLQLQGTWCPLPVCICTCTYLCIFLHTYI